MSRLLRNSLFSSADIVIMLALSLLATPVLIGHLGISLYGVFVFLNIFSIYGALSFFDLGMEGALMTHVARFEATGDHVKVGRALSIGVLYYGAIGLLLALVLYGGAGLLTARFTLAPPVRAQALAATYLVALNVLLQFLTTPFSAVLQGLHRFALVKSVNSALNFVQYMLLMSVAAWTQRIDLTFLCIVVLSAARLLVYLAAYLGIPGCGWQGCIDRAIFKALWSSSSALFINRLIGLVYNQVGKFLIWRYLPISNIAVYDVASRPGALVRVLSSMVYSAIIPEVARLKHLEDDGALRALYLRLVRYAYILVLPPIVVIAAHATRLLSVWLGPEFGQYDHLVWILMGAALFNPLPAVASTLVVGLDKVKATVWISVAGTAIHVALGFLLVEAMGVKGLLLAFFVAELVIALPYFVMMNRILAIPGADVLRPLARLGLLAAASGGLHMLLSTQNAPLPVWMLGTGALLLGHYAVQATSLLDRDERDAIFGRFRMMKQFAGSNK